MNQDCRRNRQKSNRAGTGGRSRAVNDLAINQNLGGRHGGVQTGWPGKRGVLSLRATAPKLMALLCALVLASCGSRSPHGRRAGLTPRTVKMVVAHRGLAVAVFVPVTIEGRRYMMRLDTGAGVSIIDSKVAHQLRLPSRGRPLTFRTFGCNASTQPVLVSSWRLGTLRLPAMVIGAQKLARDVGSIDGLPVVGMIASDVLSRFQTATLKYWSSQLVLSSHARPHDGLTTPMHWSRRQGFLESLNATVNGMRVRLLLDTGAAYSILDSRSVTRLDVRNDGSATLAHGAAGCTVTATPISIPVWALGGHRLPATLALSISDPDFYSLAHVSGVLGSDVLSTFKLVTLDYRQQQLQLADAMGRQP